jgi:LuxR family transcriptional regulator, maltose regulon positive regulatory protein
MTGALSDLRLVLPPLPPRHIPRSRLISALDQAADTPLTLIAAGPGAGKTVLLSDWARHRAGPTAWLTLTPSDNQPRHLWRLFASAMRASGVVSEGDAFTALPQSDPIELLDMLLTQVPNSSEPLVLVIDDAHALTNRNVLSGLDRLIRSGDRRLRLVLAARSDPLLPLHRYRLAGLMRELRAADLAMTGAETRELLAGHDVSLSDREMEILLARTEGWMAGVRLSAIRMEGTPRPADFVTDLALDHGSIGEYLIDEVLDRQPEQVRRLLVETSFLPEVTGRLADAVTGLDGCADVLGELARSNSFVIPLDHTWTRFRYHQLFRETLRYLLLRRARRLAPTLYRRAAAWYEAQDDLGNALYWAVQAGDQPNVAALLVHGGLAQAFVNGQDLASSQLSDLLPMSQPTGGDAAQATELVTAHAAIVAVTGDRDSAAHELANIYAERGDHEVADPDVRMTADLAELIVGQRANDHVAVDAASTRLLGDAAQSGAEQLVPGLRACVLLARARMSFWDGDFDDLDAQLGDALAQAERDGLRVVQVEVLSLMALINAYLCRRKRAENAAHAARALLSEMSDDEPPATLDLAAAMQALTKADLSAAPAQVIHTAMADDVIGADPVLVGALAIRQSEILLCCGQPSEARGILESGSWDEASKPALLRAHRDIMLARIETALGRPRGALQHVQGYKGTPFELAAAVPAAGAHLALGDLRTARNCVRRVLAGTGGPLTRGELVQAMLCDAQIALRSEDTARVLEMLVRALAVANDDIVLPFNEVADVFAPLLARHPTVAARWPTPLADQSDLARITAPNKRQSLPESLTDRERAVLRFLTTSMSTAEISDELCLSVNTVKTHLAAIYRKLAARKRREAVLVARELELL